jgi:hypothetical protein
MKPAILFIAFAFTLGAQMLSGIIADTHLVNVATVTTTLLDHKSGHSSGGGAGAVATTPALNCTGASLLTVSIYAAFNDPSTDVTVTDSVGGNSYAHTATAKSAFSIFLTSTFYAVGSPHVGSSQTFTARPIGASLLGISASCWSGPTVFDSADAGSFNYPCTPGSVTPTGSPSLFLTYVTSNNTTDVITVNSPFTIIENLLPVGGNSIGGALAWTTSGSAQSPTWSDTLTLGSLCQTGAWK